MKYFSIVYEPQPGGGWRYVIQSYPDNEPVSRKYANRDAVEKHAARLLERGWQWAAEYDKQQERERQEEEDRYTAATCHCGANSSYGIRHARWCENREED